MKRTLLLLAALIVPGAAAANGAAAAGAAANAAANASVAFYSGFPGSGGTLLVKTGVQAVANGQARQAVQKADAAVVTVSGQAYTFALNGKAKAKGQADLAVKGALQASGYGEATVKAVATELAEAQAGEQPLVVLSRNEGNSSVVVALYHPNGGNAGLRVKNADAATIWIHGKPHGYQVASGNGGVMSRLTLKASGGTATLASTLASLQTRAALSASANGSASTNSGSNGSSGGGSTSAGLSVSVGAGN